MNNDVVRSVDACAVSPFIDSSEHNQSMGDDSTERHFQRELKAAETIYGALHGEVGLVLLKLATYYRKLGRFEELASIEHRISEILAVYKTDLET